MSKPKYRIKKGDLVEVIAGDSKSTPDKITKGRVLDIDASKGRVLVEGANIISKHLRRGQDKNNPDGGIVKKEAFINISNVMLINPDTGKGSRTGVKKEDGKRVKYFKEHPNKSKK